jgi:hypothetical protein
MIAELPQKRLKDALIPQNQCDSAGLAKPATLAGFYFYG